MRKTKAEKLQGRGSGSPCFVGGQGYLLLGAVMLLGIFLVGQYPWRWPLL